MPLVHYRILPTLSPFCCCCWWSEEEDDDDAIDERWGSNRWRKVPMRALHTTNI